MTLIQSLLVEQNSGRYDFNKVVDECMNLRELDIFLNNLNKKAKLYQNISLTEEERDAEFMLENQNENLLTKLKIKIFSELSNINMLKEDIMYNANKLRNMLEEELGNLDIPKKQAIKIHKAYIIAKIIAENINYLEVQQKTL